MRKRAESSAPPFKVRKSAIAVSDVTPYVKTVQEWSPLDHAVHIASINEISAPMRAMFDLLANGEVLTINGKAVMEMPEGYGTVSYGEWVEIQPAINGWIGCLYRIDTTLPSRYLDQLARFLGAGVLITSELVANARNEFDAHLSRLKKTPPSLIASASITAQVAFVLEEMEENEEQERKAA